MRLSAHLPLIACLAVILVVASCGKKKAETAQSSPTQSISEKRQDKPFDINDYAGQIKLAASVVNLGPIPEGDTIKGTLTVINGTDKPARVIRCASDCGCLTVDFRGFIEIKPMTTLVIGYSLKSVRSKSGKRNRIEVVIDSDGQRRTLESFVIFECQQGAIIQNRKPDESLSTDAEPMIAAPASRITLTPARFDFGNVSADQSLSVEIAIQRPINEPLTLGRLYCSCPCVTINAPKMSFAEQEPAAVIINIDTHGLAGQKTFDVYIQTLEPERATLRAELLLSVQ